MTQSVPKGGEFLLGRVGTQPMFTVEEFTADELAIGKTSMDFLEGSVLPKANAIEHKDFPTLVALMRKAGETGLLMPTVPEKYDGLGLPERTASLVVEQMSGYGSWSVTYGAHTGIGTLPIVYFGTPEQKARFLPRIASGEAIAAYALSEPGSGSDAQRARTTAVLNAEGTHYVVNGTKQWITNGAIADIFTIFVQVQNPADGALHFSALVVERGTPGFSHGAEEHKLGLRGSSTTQLILENALVPKDNLLGEIGRGHDIAFNILNVGRYKLAVGVTGGAKVALDHAIRYAKERKQFNRAVIEFGALRQKVADAAALIYAMEASSYRVAGLIDALHDSLGEIPDDAPGTKKMAPIQEYAIESSIVKVHASEALNRIVSECLQMYGGYGYVEDYPAELAFRDARINMIFEGTNEINRMLAPGMLLKRALKGQLPLLAWFGSLEREPAPLGDGPLAAEVDAAERLKAMAGLALGAAAMKYMQKIDQEQEVLLLLADLLIDAYIIDSVVGRSLKRHAMGLPTTVSDAMTRLELTGAAERVRANARRVACAIHDGDMREAFIKKLDRHAVEVRTNVVADRRIVADHVVERGGYHL